jgi:hypothetical protein
MPECADPARRRLVLSLARQGALQATQSLLEEAVHANNVELVTNVQRMLERTLKVRAGENDAALGSTEQQLSYRGQLCNPDGSDCNRCWWERICNGEAFQQVISRAQKVVKEIKAAAAEADARGSRGYKVAF